VPESFKVLIKELQSLAIDVKIFRNDGSEIPLKEAEEDYIKNPDKYRSTMKKDEYVGGMADTIGADGEIGSGEEQMLANAEGVLEIDSDGEPISTDILSGYESEDEE
jgi:DNA-directed RNA polymerase subunit beta